MNITRNLQEIRTRIRAAAERVDRNPEDITLVAVTKTQPVERIREAIAAGVTHMGENRVQEFEAKKPHLTDLDVTYHMIGHLQTNKVKTVVPDFHWIHSVDRVKLGREIQKHAEKLDRHVDVLIQVNTSGEDSKFGTTPKKTEALVRQIAEFPNIRIHGLMTIAAFLDDAEAVRPMFRQLKQLADRIRDLALPNVNMTHLSMGMTNDYEVAIEEGATMVRIGTAIFGARD